MFFLLDTSRLGPFSDLELELQGRCRVVRLSDKDAFANFQACSSTKIPDYRPFRKRP